MSLTRSVFNEFRPFFRLFDEVARMQPSYSVLNRSFDRKLDTFPYSREPFVDLSEQDNKYVVEAELPGIKKENLEVRVGDNGQSLTIEGRAFTRSQSDSGVSKSENEGPQGKGTESQVVQNSTNASTSVSSERDLVRSSHFARTIWLPHPVNASKVSGNLTDGILTLHIPKAEDQGSIRVDIQ